MASQDKRMRHTCTVSMCKKTVGSPKVIPLKFPALQAGIKRENNQEPNLDLVCFFAIKNPKLVTLEVSV